MSISDRLIKIDQGMDYVPVISTTNNLVSLFIKSIHPILSPKAKNNPYIAHLKNKDTLRCTYLLLPVVGNVPVYKEHMISRNIRAAELAQVEELSLSFINILPPAIGRLANLTKLELNSNNLKSLPTEIGLLGKLTKLDLSKNKLTSLPAEIGGLTNLQELDLSNNKLKSLPAEIGGWTKLSELDLSNNKLKSLPGEIGRWTKLSELDLSNNSLTALPAEIGQWAQLDELDLDNNKLSTLPAEIGLLTGLTDLSLSDNNFRALPLEITQISNLFLLWLDGNPLTSLNSIGRLLQLMSLDVSFTLLTALPAEIGRLTELQTLRIDLCPNLRDLPMTLGEIPALSYIDSGDSTPVPQPIIDAIIAQCQQMRNGNAQAVLPSRLLKWKTYGQFFEPLDLNLSNEETCTLNEWLLRLEKTNDFTLNQALLAKTVFRLLADLHRSEFRESFFNQAEANNVCCQDRAAMALNEIYTTWLHLCQAHRLPEREKLQKIAGVAKTLCLRRKLQKLIQKHAPQERETVEIFLYYEIELKTRLKLETAIQTMSYGAIGKRAWIDQAALIEEVQRDFYEDLVEMPLFDQLVSLESFQKKLDELGECPKGPEESTAVLNYKVRQGEIMMEWKRGKIAAARGLLCQS